MSITEPHDAEQPADGDDAYAVDFCDRSKTIAEVLFWAAEAGKPITLTVDGRETVMAPRPTKVYVITGTPFVFGVCTDEAEAREFVQKREARYNKNTTDDPADHKWTPEREGSIRFVHRYKDYRTNRWNKSDYYITVQELDDPQD